MANEHESGLPYAFDTATGKQSWQQVIPYGRKPFVQGRDIIDLQTIIRERQNRIANLVASDGDRVEQAIAVVNVLDQTVTLTAGKIYVAGDVFPVGEATINDVPMEGYVELGVWLTKYWLTSEDEPILLGLVPGSAAEGEQGAAREVVTIAWGLSTDDEDGRFYKVYVLQDGTILDQKPPPVLEGIMQGLRLYDKPFGHYIVSGNTVSTLGVEAGKRIFSIEEGEANISGNKIIRNASLRFAETESWEVAAVPGETHEYVGGASQTITLDQFPIAEISSILLTKEKTVTLTRGALANGADGLPDNSVIEIISVVQGGTTYDQGAGNSYVRSGNTVDWAGPGPEPAIGSSYNVTYRYRASVEPVEFDQTTMTVEGGAAGGDIIVAYTYKLPRIDILGLLPSGAPVYVRGIAARENPVMPQPPSNVLPLCEIHNNWMGTPQIIADGVRTGVRMFNWAEISRRFNVLERHSRLIQSERLLSRVDRRDPLAKKNMFVDAFMDDEFRDPGLAQTAALGNGIMQLPIEVTFYDGLLTEPVMLDYVEDVITKQELATGCEKINPYQNFLPMPGALTLTPAADFWTERQTQWASPVTVEFQQGIQWGWGGPLVTESSTSQQLGTQTSQLAFLRQRSVAFKIGGFFPGETLVSLTFDGISVMPGGLPAANAQGEIVGAFTIPANVPAGTKIVRAKGAVTEAEALFTGQGTLAIDIMRRVTTINRWMAPPATESGSSGDTWQGSGASDPQAQIFVPTTPRQLLGVDFKLCHIGDENNAILVHQVAVENGIPTTSLEAEAFVSMIGATEGWKSARYNMPTLTSSDQDHAFVIKTDDADHSIAIATLGDFDATAQKAVTQHPYPIGPRLSSVNARTWTPHQDSAVTFRLIAARYPVTTKTIDIGDFDLVDCSDMQIRAITELPNSACQVVFNVERSNGMVYRLLPYQVLSLNEWITETVHVTATLTGTEFLSPILFAPVEFIAGKIGTEGTYITRAMSIAGADQISAYLKLALPAGSTVTMRYKIDADAWTALPLAATEPSTDPLWVEQNHRKTGIAGADMRIEIKLTGGAAARPRASDFGLAVM